MKHMNDSLDQLKIAAPCPANWDDMRGDERVRFCTHCQLNVYNLSALTRTEATTLVTTTEGRLCVQFYQRADGTVLTNDCPVGLQRLKKRVARLGSAVLVAFLSLASLVEGIFATAVASPSQSTSKTSVKKKRKVSRPIIRVVGGIGPPSTPSLPVSTVEVPPSLPPDVAPDPPPPPKKQ